MLWKRIWEWIELVIFGLGTLILHNFDGCAMKYRCKLHPPDLRNAQAGLMKIRKNAQ
jgi:hypothetical protein